MLLSWIVFLGFDGTTQHIHILDFIRSGTLDTSWSIRLDRLTAIMLIVVTTVSALVHLYSWGYMAHDENWREGESYKPRFFAYLSFFTFAMLMLVTADNLVQMFFGWEGVGVASYLLIGFYYRKASANAAPRSRPSWSTGSAISASRSASSASSIWSTRSTWTMCSRRPPCWRRRSSPSSGPIGTRRTFWPSFSSSVRWASRRSLFLHTWLPDAMEGPTPVSALIHAATMVTAGVFLVCRMSPPL